MKEVQLGKSYLTLVSDEDFERVSKFKWHSVPGGNTRYAIRREKIGSKRKIIRLHNFIMGVSEGVDHINRNGLDNRRENLRVASRSLNSHNTPAWGSSGFKGISKSTNGRQWKARIMKNGINYYLGKFDSKEEAYDKYLQKSRELYGEVL